VSTELLIAIAAVGALMLFGSLGLAARAPRRGPPPRALFVHTLGQPRPRGTLDGSTVALPIVHHVEEIDLAVHPVVVRRVGKDGLSCADGIRADVDAAFLVRVNPTTDDILKAARAMGAARATDPAALADRFAAKFTEALEAVARTLDFDQLDRERLAYRDQVMAVVGRDLDGYALADLAIARLTQTPLEMLDPDNVLDAQGIQKIRSLTART